LKKRSHGMRRLFGMNSARLIRIQYVGPVILATPAQMFSFGIIGRLVDFISSAYAEGVPLAQSLSYGLTIANG
jgi:hypothetical protein